MHKLIRQVMDDFDGVLLDDYDWEHYQIKGKKYDIQFDRSRLEWSCDCPAYKFRRRHKIRYCKHILEIQDKNFKRRNNGLGK